MIRLNVKRQIEWRATRTSDFVNSAAASYKNEIKESTPRNPIVSRVVQSCVQLEDGNLQAILNDRIERFELHA